MTTTAPKATGKPKNQPSTPKPKARATVNAATQPSTGQQASVQSRSLLQRAEVAPLSLTRADLQRLSVSSGQQAVQRLVNSSAVRQAQMLPVVMPTFRPMAQLQAKLTVGPVGDRYEQEADRMADRVMRMADSTGKSAAKTSTTDDALQRQANGAQKQPGAAKARPYKITPLVQRHPSHAEEEEVQAKRLSKAPIPWLQRHPSHAEEEEVQAKPLSKALTPWLQRHPSHAEEEEVQAKRLNRALAAHVQRQGNGSFEAGADFEKRMAKQRGGGRPLPPKLRTKMESGFGADFSSVRVHTGSPSVQLNRDIGAQAFTHRNEIHFGAGKYNPHSSSGQHLLAHELTHVVQQNPTVQTKRKDATPKDAPLVAKIQASPAQIQRKGFSERAGAGIGALLRFVGGAVGAGVGAAFGAVKGMGKGAIKPGKLAWEGTKGLHTAARVALTILAGVAGLVPGAALGAVRGTMTGMAKGVGKGSDLLDPRNFGGGLSKRHDSLSKKFGKIGPDGPGGSTGTSFSHDMLDRIEDALERIPTAHTKGNSELGGIRDMPEDPLMPISGASSYDRTSKQLSIVRPNIPGTKTALPPSLYNMLSKKRHRGMMDKVALGPMFGSGEKARLNPLEDEKMGFGKRSLFGDNMAMNKGSVLKWTVRHELGHAVDQKIKFTNRRARLPEFGGWKQYQADKETDPDTRRLAAIFLEKGGITATMYNKAFPHVEQITTENKEAMDAEKEKLGSKYKYKKITKIALSKHTITLLDVFTNLLNQQQPVEAVVSHVLEKLHPSMHGLTDPEERKHWSREMAGDEEATRQVQGWSEEERAEWLETYTPAIRKAADALRVAQLSPFLLADGGPVVINGRIYQFDHYGTWVSYLKSARKNVVSNYQFSSPGEWFAEAYAAYYTPEGDPARAKLNPQTRRFFEENLGHPQQPGKLPTPQNPGLIDDDNNLRELEEIAGLDENEDRKERMEVITRQLDEIAGKIEVLKKNEKYTPDPDAEDGPRATPKGPPLVGKGALKPGAILIQSGGNPAVAAGQGVATVLRAIFKGASVIGLYDAAKDLSRLKYANYVHAAIHTGQGHVAHATNSGVISGEPTENATFAVFQSSDDTLAQEAVVTAKKWSGGGSGPMGYDATMAIFGGGFGDSSLGVRGTDYAKSLAKGKKVDGMYCSEFAVAVYQVAALNITKKTKNADPKMLRLSARSTSPQRLAAKLYSLTKGGNPGWSFKGMYIPHTNNKTT